jgi:hypothetical protein
VNVNTSPITTVMIISAVQMISASLIWITVLEPPAQLTFIANGYLILRTVVLWLLASGLNVAREGIVILSLIILYVQLIRRIFLAWSGSVRMLDVGLGILVM